MLLVNVSHERESRVELRDVSHEWSREMGVAEIKNLGAYVVGIPKGLINE